jgi:hypothetical protein
MTLRPFFLSGMESCGQLLLFSPTSLSVTQFFCSCVCGIRAPAKIFPTHAQALRFDPLLSTLIFPHRFLLPGFHSLSKARRERPGLGFCHCRSHLLFPAREVPGLLRFHAGIPGLVFGSVLEESRCPMLCSIRFRRHRFLMRLPCFFQSQSSASHVLPFCSAQLRFLFFAHGYPSRQGYSPRLPARLACTLLLECRIQPGSVCCERLSQFSFSAAQIDCIFYWALPSSRSVLAHPHVCRVGQHGKILFWLKPVVFFSSRTKDSSFSSLSLCFHSGFLVTLRRCLMKYM